MLHNSCAQLPADHPQCQELNILLGHASSIPLRTHCTSEGITRGSRHTRLGALQLGGAVRREAAYQSGRRASCMAPPSQVDAAPASQPEWPALGLGQPAECLVVLVWQPAAASMEAGCEAGQQQQQRGWMRIQLVVQGHQQQQQQARAAAFPNEAGLLAIQAPSASGPRVPAPMLPTRAASLAKAAQAAAAQVAADRERHRRCLMPALEAKCREIRKAAREGK